MNENSFLLPLFSFLFFLIVIIVILWFDQIPLFLSLNSNFDRSVMIPLLVIPNKGHAPEVVKAHRTYDNVGVISLVVVTHPGSNESPETFYSRVSSESRHFLRLPPKNRSIPEVSRSKLSGERSVILLVKVRDKMRHS